ncbi:Zn-dependent protease with chaperone function [Halomonas fontilapidosi]|uniref:Zn-dependent protease with chaperone function n=1 Tax=Halomonas fontilapidosi TaxID=616675 RepID=A0A7W5DKS6_9GAMM|nr:M48 family metallopeptidase [Halomonas fontilapidosi]MBB3184750.1 Zn-dependent protease with chaperone function [Halomonas fontilapidosi]
MDFFTAQDRARRLTGRLILLLALAIVVLIGITSLVVALAVVFLDGASFTGETLARALQPQLLAGVAMVVILVVGLGSLIRHLQLRAGGSAVAEALGGRSLNLETRDANERRLLNVVEEMAIASGMPVPLVYLLEDPAINAFAAGHELDDVAIGVTRGAIETLDRDQLQGVIAHEFSHILHGDMRLNLRLVALLHGIVVIGLIGRMLLHASTSGRRTRSRKGGGHVAVLGLGAGLMVVGYAGTLCGNLIKAAVSRQREFLADASAVQYTRNPEGIGGALKLLAAHRLGSRLLASQAAEFSHLYFGSGVRSLSRLTATHPPVTARIQRVLPHWDGSLPPAPPVRSTRRQAEPASSDGGQGGERLAAGALAAAVVASVGRPSSEDIARARRRLGEIDARLFESAHEPFAARALVYGILMGADPRSREAQRDALQGQALPEVLAELKTLEAPLSRLTPGQRLPLIELALPALRQLSTAQHARFQACLRRLMALEVHAGALQWALHRLVVQGIEGARRARRDRHLADLGGPLSLLLSTLARAGQQDEGQARAAVERLGSVLGVPLDFVGEPALASDLDWAMARLVRLVQAERAPLLAAMTCCVEHDGRIAPEEGELLSAVAWTLGCPLPSTQGAAGQTGVGSA